MERISGRKFYVDFLSNFGKIYILMLLEFKMLLKTKLSKIKFGRGIVKLNGLPEGFVITDRNVFEKYRDLIKDKEKYFAIKPGEKSKSIEVYFQILEN